MLLVQHGLALLRTEALGVAGVRQTASSRSTDDVGGLGDAPLVMTLELDGGATIELAASSDARETMMGPFAETSTTDDATPPG